MDNEHPDADKAMANRGKRLDSPQRLVYLRQRFAALNIRPRRVWGQNFLLDTNLARYIARLGMPSPEDVILEVGCGSGLLTRHLVASGAQVIAVEIDGRLLNLAQEELAGASNAAFIQADILAGKHRINPVVIDAVRSALAAKGPGRRLKTISNLPYAAGTPFMANLFASDLPWDRGVFLLQREVAERLNARPGERMYGPLAICAALAGEARIARQIPPAVFWPRPAVMSAAVAFAFRPLPERMALPWPALRKIVSAVFSQRRKALRNALAGVCLSPAALLASWNMDGKVRPEEISPAHFLALAQYVVQHEKGSENGTNKVG